MSSKMKTFTLFAVVLFVCLSSSFAQAAVVDVIQAPTGFFVPYDTLKYDSPYYRWYNEDWGWTHNAITGAMSTVNLNISAFDVDNTPGNPDSQWDQIFALDSGAWVSLGFLQGANDIWSYTSFNLAPQFYDDIATGLQVRVDIDTTHTNQNWALTLAKSILTVDGGTIPPPEPTAPEPSTLVLLAAGGLSLLAYNWRRRKQIA